MNISLLQQTLGKLKLLGHTPTKRFGQNFLIDQNVVEKFVRLADIHDGDTVAEVGPGLGTVSDEILSYGAKLHAIELDKRLFNFLCEKYSKQPKFHIMNGDAVEYPIADLDNHLFNKNVANEDDFLSKNSPSSVQYKIVASLPYSISSAWFDALLDRPILPVSVSVIIQIDAANQFLAASGTKSFCPTSIFIQSAFSKIAMHKIARGAFYPVPGVDSVMLFLKKKQDGIIFDMQAKQLVRSIFQTRRKQITTIFQLLISIRGCDSITLPPTFDRNRSHYAPGRTLKEVAGTQAKNALRFLLRRGIFFQRGDNLPNPIWGNPTHFHVLSNI